MSSMGGHQRRLTQMGERCTGFTAAHAVAEGLRRAVPTFVHVVLEYQMSASKAACLEYLDHAIAWLDEADLARLDRTARWALSIEIAAYYDVVDTWLVTHQDSPQYASVERAFIALAQIARHLYADLDTWLRMNAAGLLSDDDLRRRFRGITPDACQTWVLLPDDIRAFRDRIAALP